MKAFLDKYKYILGLGLALAAVVIIAAVSAVAGKDTAENSGISYSMPETAAATSTASLNTTSAPKTSVNSNAPPATTVTGTSSQASSEVASQSHSQATVSSKKTETVANTAQATPTTTTAPITSAASEKPVTATSTTVTATTAKATTKATATVTSSASSADKITTPKPDEKPIVQYAHSCTFTIDCKTILDNRDMLKKGLEKYVPDDGMIYSGTVGFNDGESVYDILRRICDENKIQMEASFTPAFGSYYVEGINNLYEFDCGKRSGWMYCVNGVFPNYGCSSYFPVNGDIIAFRYTCELGFDFKR